MTPKRSSASREGLKPSLRPGWSGFLLAIILACGLAALAAYLQTHPTTDERGIRMVCRDLARDAERRDRAAIERLISPNYRDQRGLSREDALDGLLRYLDAGNWKRIRPVAIVVNKVDGNKASATAKVLLAQADSPTVRPGGQGAFQLDLEFAREGGGWKLLSAEDWQVPAADLEQTENE
jgi:hypothetical protein